MGKHNYFKSRRRKVYVALDPDRVDPETFEVEGPDHPHILMRQPTQGNAVQIGGLASALDPARKSLAALCVAVEGLGGQWDVYGGKEGAKVQALWDWPDIVDDKTLERRMVSLMRLDGEDVVFIDRAVADLYTLTEEEEGN